MALRHLLPAKVRMELKERSRYISVDPDETESKVEEHLMETNFANVLDKIEYELNREIDEEGELTDGFYSSEGEGEEDEKSNEQSEHSVHTESRPESSHLHEEKERNWYPELDVMPDSHSTPEYDH